MILLQKGICCGLRLQSFRFYILCYRFITFFNSWPEAIYGVLMASRDVDYSPLASTKERTSHETFRGARVRLLCHRHIIFHYETLLARA